MMTFLSCAGVNFTDFRLPFCRSKRLVSTTVISVQDQTNKFSFVAVVIKVIKRTNEENYYAFLL